MKRFIREQIVSRENNAITAEAMDLLKQLGSDQIIITYAFNFKHKDGTLNTDPAVVNKLNHAIFEKLSIAPGADPKKTPLVITTSEFDPDVYGSKFVTDFMARLGVENHKPIVMSFLSSTTMSPWLTASEDGNVIPRLEASFRSAVLDVVRVFQES